MKGSAAKKFTDTFVFKRLKILASAVTIAMLFSLFLQRKLFPSNFINLFLVIYLQLEIFKWLGYRFFGNLSRDDEGNRQKILIRFAKFYLLVLFIAIIIFLLVYTGSFLVNGADFSHYFEGLIEIEIKGFLIAALIGFTLGALFFFYMQWAEALKREQKLTREKLIFQYETLKNQVNPHFLFNSLNTISSLVREDPDLSEEYIQKLSNIYRYILRDNENELVSLSEELDFVQSYFYLRKIRDEEKISLKIDIGEMESKDLRILPVSLQLLVENALKHNTATRKDPLKMVIQNEGFDYLIVRNNLQKKSQLNEPSGIGLKNLDERCKLILNREIEISETEKEFIVRVPVKSQKQ